jgi:cell division protein FtsW (lipid II flippase)
VEITLVLVPPRPGKGGAVADLGAPVAAAAGPLVSYGGSSMLTILVGLGLVSSVSMRRRSPS